MKDKFKKSKDSLKNALSEVKDNAEDLIDSSTQKFQESRVKDGIDYVTDGTSNQLDVISGQRMYDLVQERVELQNELNDVLAFKLHEALKRIEELESKVSLLEQANG